MLPVVAAGDVSAAAFTVILQFMYTNDVAHLPPAFMEAPSAAELFDAADRLLLFSMKVITCHTLTRMNPLVGASRHFAAVTA